jgi:hypothetical protein
MAISTPLINGFYHAYADIELRANGLQFAGVVAIDYDDNLNRAKVRGTAAVPLGLTKGAYEANGSLEFLLEAAQLLQTTLLPAFRQVPVTCTVSYVPSGIAPLPLISDSFTFYIGQVTQSNKVGDDALTRKFTMHIPGQIFWNGVPSIIETSTIGSVG